MGDRARGRPVLLARAVEEFSDWQALTIFLTYCAAVDVVTLAQVDRVLLRSCQSHLARRSDRGVVFRRRPGTAGS